MLIIDIVDILIIFRNGIQFTQNHFHRGEIFFFLIALTAADDHIAFGTASAPGERHDMIQRQFGCREFFSAVVTDAPPEKLLKMSSFAQFPGLLPFSADVGFVFIDLDPIIH